MGNYLNFAGGKAMLWKQQKKKCPPAKKKNIAPKFKRKTFFDKIQGEISQFFEKNKLKKMRFFA